MKQEPTKQQLTDADLMVLPRYAEIFYKVKNEIVECYQYFFGTDHLPADIDRDTVMHIHQLWAMKKKCDKRTGAM